MTLNTEPGKIRAVIPVTSADEPAKVADIASVFKSLVGFNLEIVGCSMLSLIDLPIAGAAIGIPIPSFAVKQSIKRTQAEVQDICNEAISIVDKDSSVDIEPKAGYINGPLNQIVPKR